MTNPYYTFTPRFLPGTKVRSGDANLQFDALQTAFDLFPANPDGPTHGTATLGIESGAANTYVLTMPNPRVSYADGDEVVFRATHTNTGAATLKVDALSALALRRFDGTALSASDVVSTQFYAARYQASGNVFLIVWPTLATNVGVLTYGGPTATVSTVAVNGVATTVMRSDAAPAIDLAMSPAWTGTHTFLSHPLTVPSGGTGINTGTSGGILGFTGSTTLASSVVLTANRLVLGGGAGATPAPLGSSGTTTTVLHGDAAGAPTFGAVSLTADVSGVLPVANGGTALSSGTSGGVLGFTAAGVLASSVALTANQLVLGGGAGATPTPLGSLGTTTTVLHGNAGGAPTYGAVSLTTDISGVLPIANGGTNASTAAGAFASLGTAVTLTAGAGLTGGGDLTTSRTFDVGAGTGVTVNANDVALDTASTRNTDHASVTLTAGAGLTGGGDITTSRTVDVGAGTGITVNTNDVAVNQAFTPTWTGLHTFSPSGASGVLVNGADNNYAIRAIGGATSSQSFGVSIQAGTSASDTALLVKDATGATTRFQAFGDGGMVAGNATGGNQGFGTLNANGLFVNGVSVLTAGTSFKIASGIINESTNTLSNAINCTANTHPATGSVTINVTAAGFASNPAVIAQHSQNGSQGFVQSYATSTTSISIDAQNAAGSASDSVISFICIGV